MPASGHSRHARTVEQSAQPEHHFVWTCNKDTKEHVVNDGSVVAIMRITDLKA